MSDFLFASCASGSESWLADECRAICGPDVAIEPGRGGVSITAGVDAAMRLNLHSRIAQRILWPVVDGPYRDENELYELARQVRWGDWITPDETLRVDVSAQRSPLNSLNFAALRIKDAVCDVMREATGSRPSVNTHHPDLAISLHVGEDHAWIAIDLSGEALFKRGWREQQGEAPLKETLAATMLIAAGWQGRESDGPLMDPCCGAGTIAIEAAQVACHVAPGLTRRFAFERLRPFRDHVRQWADLRRQAQEAILPQSPVPIWAGDVSFRMTDFAVRNAQRAGVAHAIEFLTVDALQRTAPAAQGTILMNPPYGERIEARGTGSAPREARPSPAARPAAPARTFIVGRPGEASHAGRADNDALPAAGASPRAERFDRGDRGGRESAVGGTPAEFFSALASHWKHHYAGWTAWVLSPDMKLPSLMRLKESKRTPLWNGPIECRLFRFDLVAGSAREGRGAVPARAEGDAPAA